MYVSCNSNYSLFVWSSNLIGCPVFHLAIQLALHSVSTLKVLNLMDGCRLDRMWASLLGRRGNIWLSLLPLPSVLIAGYTPHRPLIGLIWRAASDRAVDWQDGTNPVPALSTWPWGPPGAWHARPLGCMLHYHSSSVAKGQSPAHPAFEQNPHLS